MECGQFCHFSFGSEQRNDPVAENLEVSLKFSDMNDPLFEKFRVLPEIPERFRLHYRLQRQEQVPGPFRSADSQKCQKILVAEPFKTRFFQMKKMDLGRVDVKCGDGFRIPQQKSQSIVPCGQDGRTPLSLDLQGLQQVFGILPAI